MFHCHLDNSRFKLNMNFEVKVLIVFGSQTVKVEWLTPNDPANAVPYRCSESQIHRLYGQEFEVDIGDNTIEMYLHG